MLDAMRRYVLNDGLDLPPELKLFVWPYRGLRQTVLRGVGVSFGFMKVSPPLTVCGDFLKYFPAAFWLTFEMPDSLSSQIADRELDPRGCGLDESRSFSVPTRLRDTFRADWPERPEGFEALFLNDQACVYAEPSVAQGT
jgi:hypothetical protein